MVLSFQDNLDVVEELLKNQEDFEKMLQTQEDRFQQLMRETKVRMGHCNHVRTGALGMFFGLG